MPYTLDEKKRAINRLRRIKGQAAALERAVEEEIDCRELLQQIAALRGAANGLMAEVLESHLRELFGHQKETTTAQQLNSDSDLEIDALVKLLRTYLK